MAAPASLPVEAGRWRSASAVRVAGADAVRRLVPHSDSLEPDFAELTAEAGGPGRRRGPGCWSLARPGPGLVTDRAGWVKANVGSFQRLLKPLTDKFEGRIGNVTGASGPPAAGGRGGRPPRLDGHRVLGQYDLLVIEDDDDRDDQDVVYYVGPNVLALEKRVRVPAPGVPPVAGPPRGHPPGPVHGRAVAAAALPGPGRPDLRLGRRRPERRSSDALPAGDRGARKGKGATRWPTAALAPPRQPQQRADALAARWPG